MIITFHHLANLFEYPTRGCHVWQLRQSSCISRQWIPAWNDPEIGEDIAYHTHSTVLGKFQDVSRILYWLILMTSLCVCFGANGFMTTFLQVVDLFTLKPEAKTTAHSTSSRASVKCFEGWTCLKSESDRGELWMEPCHPLLKICHVYSFVSLIQIVVHVPRWISSDMIYSLLR